MNDDGKMSSVTRVGSKSTWRRDVQGLRAVAILSVVCFHAGLPLPGGFSGVDIFFVISGYVITQMLLREWERTGDISFRKFYLRRLKRLVPALTLVICTTVLLSWLLLSPLSSVVHTSTLTGAGAILTISNLVISLTTGGYFDAAANSNPLLNMWSLSVEEQFYLLFPLSLYIFLKYVSCRISYRNCIIAVSSILILSALFALLKPFIWYLLGFYSPLARAWEFLAGAALGLFIDHVSFGSGSVRLAGFTSIFSAFLILLGFFVIKGQNGYPNFLSLIPVIGTFGIILSNKNYSGVIRKFLESSPMTFIGDISYSWYLWHWPIIVFTSNICVNNKYATTVAALGSLIPAYISYRFIENPIRQRAIYPMGKESIFTFRLIVGVLSLCFILFYANNHGYWSKKITAYKDAMDKEHAGLAAGCGQGYVPTSLPDGTCTWNVGARGTPIYLIGDSNADHLSEAVIGAATRLGSPASIITKGGCAFIGRSWSDRNDVEQRKCLRFVDDTISLISRSKPGIVVIGLSDSIWWPHVAAVGPTRSSETSDLADTEAYLRSQLLETVEKIKQHGHRVILVQPPPKFVTPAYTPMFSVENCDTYGVLVGSCPKKFEVPFSYEKRLQKQARLTLRDVADATGSGLIDLRPVFCDERSCTDTAKDGSILYRNAGHLSVYASRMLAPLFYKKIRQYVDQSAGQK